MASDQWTYDCPVCPKRSGYRRGRKGYGANVDPIGTALILAGLVLLVFGLQVWEVWRWHR